MEKVESGMFVSVEYEGTLKNGEVFDTNRGCPPLEVQMGAGQLISGFENALLGMGVNETKQFTIEPDDAYGHRDESLVRQLARKDVPQGMKPQVGQTVALCTQKGDQIPAKITGMDDQNLTLDLNHPLAGQALHFEVQVLGISRTPTQEPSGCSCGCDGASDCC
jgi:peptidylprolyl isomerase